MQTRWQQVRGWGVVGLVVFMLVGCATTPSRDSTGELMDDAAITAKVHAVRSWGRSTPMTPKTSRSA